MGRELLAGLGYDPDEPLELTPRSVCGAAAYLHVILRGGFPEDARDIQKIVDDANFNLVNADFDPIADEALIRSVLQDIPIR